MVRTTTLSPYGLIPLLAVLALATGLVVLTPMTASAHTYLESSDPEADTTVTEPLETVTLVFNQAVDQTIGEAGMVGPGEDQVGDGDPRIDGARVELAVHPLPEHGEYTVHYRVIAADGHPVEGTFSFTYEGPVPPEEAEEPEGSEEPEEAGESEEADDDRDAAAAAPPPHRDAPAPTPPPQAVETPAPAVAEQPQPSAAAMAADAWPLLLVTGIVLAAATTASVYATRAVARWQPDPGS